MARIQVAGELHKVTFITVGNRVIRGCVNCGATWELMPVNNDLLTPKYAWKPIAEVDEDGKEVHFRVDINNCEHVEDATPTKPAVPATRGISAVESAVSKRGGVKAVCYCDDCKGKGQHWQDDDRCFCKSCRGKKAHYAA